MLTAVILICSLATAPELASCTGDNAVNVMRVPESFGTPATCFMHGQAYLAGTSIGRDLAQDERVKVLCVRAASAPSAPTPVGAAQAQQPVP